MNQPDRGAKDSRTTVLTKRQAECLALAGQGLTSKEIAKAIGLSPSTVDNHINTAVARLGARNRVEAAHFMLIAGPPNPLEQSLILADNHAQRRPIWASLVTPPPLGGQSNAMPPRQRLFHIAQIALLALAFVSGVILTIAGVVYVFS